MTEAPVVSKPLPRASLCITILEDEDYHVLMTSKGGPEAFGVFVAMLVLARARLQNAKARRLSKSDSLIFDSSISHLLALAHVSKAQLDRCLSVLKIVAKETGGQPWMYLDESKHLVIRSFFKFNTKTGWGGPREGAGRKSSGNQDDSESNQDETILQSSWVPSGSGSGSCSGVEELAGGGRAQKPEEELELEPIEPQIPPPVRNHPDDVARVVEKCGELLPLNGWGHLAKSACNEFPAVWVLEALQLGAPGNPRSWRLIAAILRRFKSQGGPDSMLEPKSRGQPVGNGSSAVSRSEQQLQAWLAENEELDRAEKLAMEAESEN